MANLKRKQFVIVDDNPNIPIIIEHLLFIHNMEGDLNYFNNPLDAIPYLKKEICDLLFLDIDMPQISGFDLLRELEIIPDTVILTAYSFIFAEQTFEYIDKGVIDYVSKARLFEQFERIKERYLYRKNESALLSAVNTKEKEVMLLVTEHPHKMIKLSLSEIVYFEQDGDKTYITTPQSFTHQYRIKQKISEVLKWVPENDCYSLNKHTLIMLNHVVAMRKNLIDMGKNSNGESIILKVAYHRRKILFEKLKEMRGFKDETDGR